jgi:hypothetical protein
MRNPTETGKAKAHYPTLRRLQYFFIGPSGPRPATARIAALVIETTPGAGGRAALHGALVTLSIMVNCPASKRNDGGRVDIPSARSRYGLLFPLAVERCKILIRKLDARGRNVLFKVLHLRRTWNWQHHGAALENPCKRDLTRRDAVALRDLVQQRSRSG